MASNVSFDPYAMTVANGSFSIQSEGYIQGVYLDDPAIRNELAGGYSSDTLPLWGGIAISEDVALAESAGGVLGGQIARSTSNANITGFTVFNQAVSMLTSPNSPVPTAGTGRGVNFFRLGSGIRIPVACDPSLASLRGGLITQQVSWDINNQVLQPFDSATSTVTISSITATFANGVYTCAVVCAAASLVGGVGDVINISGATNSGTGGAGLINGNHVVTAFTDNEHFSFQVTAASGAIGTIAGSPVLNEGTGALPVKVLGFNVGNSMTVNYDPVNNVATWIRNGSCAVILL